MDFLKAPSWDISHQIVRANQGMINVWIEITDSMLEDCATILRKYPGRSLSEATATLKTHRTVLLLCRKVGITAAFAEVQRNTTRKSGGRTVAAHTSGHGLGPVTLWAAALASAIPALFIVLRPGVLQSHYIHGYLGVFILFLPASAIIAQPVFRGSRQPRRSSFLIAASIANALVLDLFYLAAMNGALNGDRLMNATAQGVLGYLGIMASIIAFIAAIRRRAY